jgi:uncharacterized coiled-coil protein SlyX
MKLQNLIHILMWIVCIGLLPRAQAVSPPPPGGYPNFTTAAGEHALQALTLGVGNTAIGTFSLFSVTTGSFNTALGAGALDLNTADSNTATGAAALLFNTTGTENTANGTAALEFNETGDFNNAVGAFALFNNTDGFSNNALGESALFNNQIGSGNTAIGDVALENNDSDGAGLGNANTAVGAAALLSNIDGDSNNAVGFHALGSNVDGSFNNVMGFDAMADNVSGAGNVAIGDSAGTGVEGDFNIYIGAFAGPDPSPAPVNESETIRIGDVFNTACFIGGIWGQTASGGLAVFIDGNGKLGTVTSSARFKDDIKPMGKASEALFSLKPVTFRYKKEIDSKGIPQFGLVAEDVEAFNPDLVVRDQEGKPYSVRYDMVNAMLLNEFLKEHCRVEEQQGTIGQLKSNAAKQEATISELKKDLGVLTAQLKEQAAQIQKVSAQLEMSHPPPQMVVNNH